MLTEFAHVHVHSEYSLLCSIIRMDDLVRTAAEMRMPAVAVTDHASISGAIKLYHSARNFGVKPLIGCEVNVKEECQQADAMPKHFHLSLLSMNATGYRNLLQLTSLTRREDVTRNPFLDNKLLAKYSEGLLVLSGDSEGQIPWLLFHDCFEEARNIAKSYHEVFGDRFYLELQENGISGWARVQDGLQQLGHELGIKVVASNDCHYMERQDYLAHQVFLCIQTGRTMNDPERFSFSTAELYFKSPEEMARQFERYPETLANTLEVAERCNLELNLDRRIAPRYPALPGQAPQSMLEKASREGLEKRLYAKFNGAILRDEAGHYWCRLEEELAIIRRMDVAVYFLIVADFVNWARKQDIPVGPGRGASAGSLVAYSLYVTDVDPIQHNLYFERFLNWKRSNIPDIDIDVCYERREEVIGYLARKYGRDNVSQVISFKRLGPRLVLRRVGRALEIQENKLSHIAELVHEYPPVSLSDLVSKDPCFREIMEADDTIASLITVSQKLEGVVFDYGVNPAAIVIAPDRIADHVPVCHLLDSDLLTLFDRKDSEKSGLIVFDILHLKALTVIDKAIRRVRQETGAIIDLASIKFDDPETLAQLSRGENVDIFPLKYIGKVLKMLRPCQFSDLSALIALYRPGPLEASMLDEYIDNKQRQYFPDYPVPILGSILNSTWGVLLYQEQVMRIAQVVANYSAVDADIFWRRVAGKNYDVLEEDRQQFISEAMANKISFEAATEIFSMLVKYSDLCFPQAYCVAYAAIAYQMAYINAHYPDQFSWSCAVVNVNEKD